MLTAAPLVTLPFTAPGLHNGEEVHRLPGRPSRTLESTPAGHSARLLHRSSGAAGGAVGRIRVPGKRQLIRSFRWVRSRLSAGVVILGYHRLGSGFDDPFGLDVTSERFTQHLDVLQRHGSIVSLADAIAALRTRRIPSRAVVLTFDDGYVDTATQVVPLLERARAPATVFVTPGSPGLPFWWDDLTQMLLRHSPLPSRLDLDVRGKRHSWVLTDGRTPHGDVAARRRALLQVAAALRDLDPEIRRERMLEIRQWCGHGDNAPQRGLTLDEIRDLASSDLVEIGAHTMSHPVLPSLPFERQMEEIQQSRLTLEKVAGRPVRAFSYPHGSFSSSTVAGVRAAGFSMACCSTPDVARSRSNLLTLPRLWAPNVDGPRFEAWLTRWLVP